MSAQPGPIYYNTEARCQRQDWQATMVKLGRGIRGLDAGRDGLDDAGLGPAAHQDEL